MPALRLILLLTLLAAGLCRASPDLCQTRPASDKATETVLSEINAVRIARGLAPLVQDDSHRDAVMAAAHIAALTRQLNHNPPSSTPC